MSAESSGASESKPVQYAKTILIELERLAEKKQAEVMRVRIARLAAMAGVNAQNIWKNGSQYWIDTEYHSIKYYQRKGFAVHRRKFLQEHSYRKELREE